VLHLLYRWLFPCSMSTTLMVRSVPMGCTGRVFHALCGKHSALLATPLRRPTRCSSTVLPHLDHADWFDLSFVHWGFRGHESVKSATLRVLTDFCDHNPTMVSLSPFGLFPVVRPHDTAWLDHMDHLRELLLLAEPLDVTQTLARCLNVVFTLQGLRYNTAQ
jgi:hypothetical protein